MHKGHLLKPAGIAATFGVATGAISVASTHVIAFRQSSELPTSLQPVPSMDSGFSMSWSMAAMLLFFAIQSAKFSVAPHALGVSGSGANGKASSVTKSSLRLWVILAFGILCALLTSIGFALQSRLLSGTESARSVVPPGYSIVMSLGIATGVAGVIATLCFARWWQTARFGQGGPAEPADALAPLVARLP